MALATGLTYVILASRANNACWLFGIISCVCIAWDDFTVFKLYADGVLQILYVVLGFVGLANWLRDNESKPGDFNVQEDSLKMHLIAIGTSVLLAWPVSFLLAEYTDAAFGYLDTLTTLASIYATTLLIRKVASNWLYWIIIDIVYVYLFASSGGIVVAVLYLIFALVAFYGWRHWLQLRTASIEMESK